MNESGYFEITVAGQAPAADETKPAGVWQWHARLEWQGQSATITDLSGRQPVVVNGSPLNPHKPTVLNEGDTIEFAGTQIVWRSGPPSSIAQTLPPEPTRYLLVITTPDWTRELPLLNPVISLGRAPENDIIINNQGISRRHARLEQREDGYAIIDESSTFGLRHQGQPVSKKQLADGDEIQIANEVTLTFKVTGPTPTTPLASKVERTSGTAAVESVQTVQARPPKRGQPSVGEQTNLIDMTRFLEVSDGAAPTSTNLWETSMPHLVIYLVGRTWPALLTREQMSIGRDDDNDVVIPDASVSGRHATITRKGDHFIIGDANSGNGVWVRKQRVDSYRLRPGDVVHLGRAKLVFKGGFSPDDLTLIGAPVVDGKRARRPVVFVPGLGGSELWLGSEQIYPVPKILFSNPEALALPGDPRVEARRIVSDVVIVPGIFKQEQYSRLGDYLESGLGYHRGRDLLEYAYDWRQDIRHAARGLAKAIERWRPGAPITIIAHSLGTLVTRYYVERLGGKRVTERIVLMGGPQYGTPKALLVNLVGPGVLPFGIGDDRLRRVMAHFPTSYQILPIYPSVFDQYGQQIDVLRDETWLPTGQRPYLRLARDFRNELGYRSSVPCVSIFGYGFKTAVRVQIERRSDGRWRKASFVEEVAGDLSVPAGSAVLKNSEIHPVFQEHGALYVDDDVKMRLKVELTRSTTLEGSRI